jgi:hypothetical protein
MKQPMSAVTLVCSGLCVLLLGLGAAGCGRSNGEVRASMPPGVSWYSLLAESTDLSMLAQRVEPAVRSRMVSSASDPHKVMLAHLAPEMIGDMDYGCFTEVVTNRDGYSATLGTFNGPGVVTWVWSANPVGTLSLYVDNTNRPALSMPFEAFLHGDFLPVREPFGTVTSQGHNLHFPIVHAKFCKCVVTVPRLQDLAQLYYQVAWKSLPTNVAMQPFDAAQIQQEAGLLKSIGKRLLACSKSVQPLENVAVSHQVECSLRPGEALEIFRANGPQAIRGLRFAGRSKADLGGLWLRGNWDGDEAVQVPLHMLAGVSSALEDTQALPVTVAGSRVFLRWFMPFATQGSIVCSNSSDRACRFSVEVWTRPVEAASYPLRFHANWHRHEKLKPRAGTLLTFADVSGPGRFVGCVLDVESRSDRWWGEGDNLVWLDGTNAPALHGTGTEDYFGFAWCSPVPFQHPFRGQTRVVQSRNLWSSTMHRYHLLDGVSFERWGRFQFTALGVGDGEMDWTAATLWYETPSSQRVSPKAAGSDTNIGSSL